MPLTPEANSTISPDWMLFRPYTRAMPSPTDRTRLGERDGGEGFGAGGRGRRQRVGAARRRSTDRRTNAVGSFLLRERTLQDRSRANGRAGGIRVGRSAVHAPNFRHVERGVVPGDPLLEERGELLRAHRGDGRGGPERARDRVGGLETLRRERGGGEAKVGRADAIPRLGAQDRARDATHHRARSRNDANLRFGRAAVRYRTVARACEVRAAAPITPFSSRCVLGLGSFRSSLRKLNRRSRVNRERTDHRFSLHVRASRNRLANGCALFLGIIFR